MTQHIVAIGNGVHNDPEGINIVQLVHSLALGVHLPIDGVHVLDPSVSGAVDVHRGQPLGDFVLNGVHKSLILSSK